MEKKEEHARGGIVVYGMHGAMEYALVYRFIKNEYQPNLDTPFGISHFTKTVSGHSLDIFIGRPGIGSTVKSNLAFANMAMLVMPCTANFADCQEFLQETLAEIPRENYKFIIVIDQSEFNGTPKSRLSNKDAQALLNSHDSIEALYCCSAKTGDNIENAFNHALWNKEIVELNFFQECFEAAKNELQKYKGFKESYDIIGPIKFFHSRCNSTLYLFNIITLYQQQEVTQISARCLARIVFDHYTIIKKIRSDLSLCLERILVGLLGKILNININTEYQRLLQQRSAFKKYSKSNDVVYRWLIDQANRCDLPSKNETAMAILEYIQSLEVALNYKCGLTENQQRIEHLIKFACHFVTQLYSDQFNGIEHNLASLRKEYEEWARKNTQLDTTKIAEILKVAHIRIAHHEDESDEEMLEFNN